jgi:hypothetical protein
MTDLNIPTARDVIDHLNERFAARGLPYRIDTIAVLPYVSPMWLSNWSVPQLDAAPERDVIDEEIAEARWKWPQVLDEQWEANPPSAV